MLQSVHASSDGPFLRTAVTDDLESIAAFVRVAREGSFSAAARKVGVSPSAISKRIARLEARAGGGAVHSHHAQARIVGSGSGNSTNAALKASTASKMPSRRCREFRGTPSGLLRVKVPQAFGRLHIAPSIPEFMARYPDIQVDLIFGRLTGDMMDERIDVLVASADPPDVNLSAKMLAPIERVACVAPSYIERLRASCDRRGPFQAQLPDVRRVGFRGGRVGASWPRWRQTGEGVRFVPHQ